MTDEMNEFFAWLMLILVPHAIVQIAVIRALTNIENHRPAVVSRLPFRRVDWMTAGLIASIALAFRGRAMGLNSSERALFRTFFATYILSILVIVGYVATSQG
ncbi:hypothetical protein [Arenimonas sp. SCN 70-307]|uniref:hypothetical protein n=1 Tax=Arenimonas sp. SCN 70-307 TaxID=1660089 RepID=UPI0025BAFAE3|nr:hypothetical protein [Arenimonas sp. SCN 70-307]